MPGTWSLYRSWTAGDNLTASDLTASFQTVLNNATPTGVDDYSTDVSQMQSITDPYPASSESLASSLAGELERIRYVLKAITGRTQWYKHTEALSFGTQYNPILKVQIFS